MLGECAPSSICFRRWRVGSMGRAVRVPNTRVEVLLRRREFRPQRATCRYSPMDRVPRVNRRTIAEYPTDSAGDVLAHWETKARQKARGQLRRWHTTTTEEIQWVHRAQCEGSSVRGGKKKARPLGRARSRFSIITLRVPSQYSLILRPRHLQFQRIRCLWLHQFSRDLRPMRP